MKAKERPGKPASKSFVALRTLCAARPVSTCPRCGSAFRAESRAKVECPTCGYRLLGGI